MKRWQLTDRIGATALGDWGRRALQARVIRKWQRKGCPFRTPHEYKQATVLDYARRYGLRVFVETGTQHGRMLMAMQRHFDQLFSIELHPQLFAFSRTRFTRFPHVHLLEGDSAREVARVLDQIEGDALFWLDAHFFPHGPSGETDDLTPLLGELAVILQQRGRRHVILADDAHSFTPEQHYPPLEDVRALVQRLRPDLEWSVEHDIMRIVPRS